MTRPVSPPRPPENDCQRGLVALIEGRIAEWSGSDGCTRADLDRAFGATGDADVPGRFGRALDFPARGIAPHGFTAWFWSYRDGMVLVWIALPRLDRPLDDVLGPPDVVRPPRHASATARAWTARGLIELVDPDGTVGLLLGIRRTTPEGLDASKLLPLLDQNEEAP